MRDRQTLLQADKVEALIAPMGQGCIPVSEKQGDPDDGTDTPDSPLPRMSRADRNRPTREQRTKAKQIYKQKVQLGVFLASKHCWKASHFNERFERKALLRGQVPCKVGTMKPPRSTLGSSSTRS